MKVAQFKARHGDALPEAQVRNHGAAERASQRPQGIEAQIRAGRGARGPLEVQLSKFSPTLGSTTGNAQAELAVLQGQLADARVRYTPDHPDVKRLQRQIEALVCDSASEPERRRIVAEQPGLYRRCRASSMRLEAEIAALQAARHASAQSDLRVRGGMAAAAPDVEQDYAELARNRDVLQSQFDGHPGEAARGGYRPQSRDGAEGRPVHPDPVAQRPEHAVFAQSTRHHPAGDRTWRQARRGLCGTGRVVRSFGAQRPRLARRSPVFPPSRPCRSCSTEADRRRNSLWWVSYACVLIVATAFVAATVFTA